ncbi:hypothetical protein GMA7_92 [Gordonia phage GMA7]|uniref:Uncharacterized protein n=1 Tax=Gordonia phage GMA7 TaxID=1647286 RepID=A0A0K0N6H3_9CAUD|nr:hypothetical protein AU104_gp026 [Gordonia phage GMA7]AKJ72529.1 hypothetical protein GMA7_92 [Gordonia phage GMA7]
MVGTINTIASLTGHSFLHCLCGTTYDLRIFFWYRGLSRELFSTRRVDQTLLPMSSPNCWPLYGPYATRVPNRLHSTGGPNSARQRCNQRGVIAKDGCHYTGPHFESTKQVRQPSNERFALARAELFAKSSRLLNRSHEMFRVWG